MFPQSSRVKNVNLAGNSRVFIGQDSRRVFLEQQRRNREKRDRQRREANAQIRIARIWRGSAARRRAKAEARLAFDESSTTDIPTRVRRARLACFFFDLAFREGHSPDAARLFRAVKEVPSPEAMLEAEGGDAEEEALKEPRSQREGEREAAVKSLFVALLRCVGLYFSALSLQAAVRKKVATSLHALKTSLQLPPPQIVTLLRPRLGWAGSALFARKNGGCFISASSPQLPEHDLDAAVLAEGESGGLPLASFSSHKSASSPPRRLPAVVASPPSADEDGGGSAAAQMALCADAAVQLLAKLQGFSRKTSPSLFEGAVETLCAEGLCPVFALIGTAVARERRRCCEETRDSSRDILALLQNAMALKAFRASEELAPSAQAFVAALVELFSTPNAFPALEDSAALQAEAIEARTERAASLLAPSSWVGSLASRGGEAFQSLQSQTNSQEKSSENSLGAESGEAGRRRLLGVRLLCEEALRAEDVFESLRRKVQLCSKMEGNREGEEEAPVGVCLAANLLSLLVFKRASQKTGPTASSPTAPPPPSWIIAALQFCSAGCGLAVLQWGLLSSPERRALSAKAADASYPATRRTKGQTQSDAFFLSEEKVSTFEILTEGALEKRRDGSRFLLDDGGSREAKKWNAFSAPQLRAQLQELTSAETLAELFASQQATRNLEGVANLLRIFFPPEGGPEPRSFLSGTAAAFLLSSSDADLESEASSELESDLEGEDLDESSLAKKQLLQYADSELLVLNAVANNRPFVRRLLELLKAFVLHFCNNRADKFFAFLGEAPRFEAAGAEVVRTLCILLRFKLQMGCDSELMASAEEEAAGETEAEPSSQRLRPSELQWVFRLLNELSWRMLKAISAAPSSGGRCWPARPSTAAPPKKLFCTEPRTRAGRGRRQALRILLPAVVRELVELNARSPFLQEADLLLSDRLLLESLDGRSGHCDVRALRECIDSNCGEMERAAAGEPSADGERAEECESRLGGKKVFPADTRLLAAALVKMPHGVPFERRLWIFFMLLSLLGRDDARLHFYRRAFRIRRSHIVEDGLAALLHGGSVCTCASADVQEGFRVEFVTEEGNVEAGIDGGGLFKEFVVELSRKAFDPAYGLFKACDDNTLFPNPDVALLHPNFAELYTALGRLVGKAILCDVLIEPQLNRVFVSQLLGRPIRIDDVKALDAEVHRSLMFLKAFKGDVESLSIAFSVTSSDLAGNCEVDLIPGGRNVPVTNSSKLRYLQTLADFKCRRQVEAQVEAFSEGLGQALPLRWLQMFSPGEIQLLISGTSQGFDVKDLRANTCYSGGYEEDHPCIAWLWELLDEMEDDERSAFLMFVTSCSRAPLRGFSCLSPKFTVHRVPDATRLPTSSTCVNLFKLPEYSTKEELRSKLREAVKGAKGFGLS